MTACDRCQNKTNHTEWRCSNCGHFIFSKCLDCGRRVIYTSNVACDKCNETGIVDKTTCVHGCMTPEISHCQHGSTQAH